MPVIFLIESTSWMEKFHFYFWNLTLSEKLWRAAETEFIIQAISFQISNTILTDSFEFLIIASRLFKLQISEQGKV